jgi:hypothetical protein
MDQKIDYFLIVQQKNITCSKLVHGVFILGKAY